MTDPKYVYLHASCLSSKFGFGDGDILCDLVVDGGLNLNGAQLPPEADHLVCVEHEVLARAVERYLVPALPVPVRLYRVGSIHNPIRVEDDVPKLAAEVCVTVTVAQLQAIADELKGA